MTIRIHLLHQSLPVERTDVRNAYTKDGMYCVLLDDGIVEKYPLVHIFRVIETS